MFAGLDVVCARWPAPHDAREALIRAALVFGAIVTFSTEILSLFGAISAADMTVLWMVLVVLAGIAVFATRAQRGGPRAGAATGRPAISPLIAAACATILGVTLVVAVVAPPNYADALSYHMGRVAHWIQAGNVGYYPTGIERQNYQLPFAEFVILHLQLLSGGDRWASLVQWAAFALSGVTVSLILAELRQSPRVQWAGALITYATPMAILQASGAQNDLVVGLWLLAFLLYLWRALSDRSLESAVLCGLALGLALATKGTAYLYAPVMGGALVAGWLARASRGTGFPPAWSVAAACLVAVCLNLGPWSRSMSASGKPICCAEGYFMERFSPGGALSNVVWNGALHFGVPRLTGIVVRGAEILSPVDLVETTNTFGQRPFEISFSYNEGKAGNTLHLLAVLGAAFVILAHARLRRGPAITWLATAVAGFLAFSIALKWQPWGSRLHTPVFLAASIPIAMALGSLRRWLAATVLTLLFAGSLFYVFLNQQRPFLPILQPSIWSRPRVEQYLPEFPDWQAAYARGAEFVRASREPEVGLLFSEVDYEYVLWALVKEDFAGPPLLRHVGVEPIPGGPPAQPPPALVVTSRTGERHVIDGFEYVRVRDFGRLSILRRDQ